MVVAGVSKATLVELCWYDRRLGVLLMLRVVIARSWLLVVRLAQLLICGTRRTYVAECIKVIDSLVFEEAVERTI
ncbi:hypothetical protein D9611_008291 [Ephemerocybe angulata]|uniref:Uncharacterized protein n=1 Tax=Ephemerocybe angulata TaxID=980116 RepID=A0A8H5F4Z0_9AGAR|nr:hypothetical protein D9611_008291 [Tulosesus angulatus]